MAADAYIVKCLRTKLKTELLSLGRVLGVPLRKSWTKERMIGSVAGRYEEDPEILFCVLSLESSDFLRKRLRNPLVQAGMKDSVYRELEFLGLVQKLKYSAEKKRPPVEKGESPVEAKGFPLGKRGDALRDGSERLFEGSGAKAILLARKQAGFIRRLDEMEKVARGMLRCFGLLEVTDLTDMAAKAYLERDGVMDHKGLSKYEALRMEFATLLHCRLGLLNFARTYVEGGRIYLVHPSATNPERLRYSILASPVKDYREFTFKELLSLGEGEETSGAAYLGLLELLGGHPYKENGKVYIHPAEDALSRARVEGEGPERNHLRIDMQEGKAWEKDILQIKSRIREGAPNLEIVREVMERLVFEDHQEVSHFLERFISHCDDIPRWNLKGYRMNEI